MRNYLRETEGFDETRLHPKATAIDAPKFIEFDWEGLSIALGEAREEISVDDYQVLGQVLGQLLRWITAGDDFKIIGRRAVALAWSINPNIFEGGPSAAALARKMGCSPAVLSISCAAARREFSISNRASGHAWNFKKTPDCGTDSVEVVADGVEAAEPEKVRDGL